MTAGYRGHRAETTAVAPARHPERPGHARSLEYRASRVENAAGPHGAIPWVGRVVPGASRAPGQTPRRRSNGRHLPMAPARAWSASIDALPRHARVACPDAYKYADTQGGISGAEGLGLRKPGESPGRPGRHEMTPRLCVPNFLGCFPARFRLCRAPFFDSLRARKPVIRRAHYPKNRVQFPGPLPVLARMGRAA